MWRPGTKTVLRSGWGWAVGVSARPGKMQLISYRAPKAGRYYVEVRVRRPGGARYALQLSKSRT